MIFKENQLIDDGRYRVQSYIARGGMAEVWRAERLADGVVCALKILTRRSIANPQIVERFNLEYDLLQRLKHPHIIAAYDFGWQTQGTSKLPWYSMEYFPQTFRQRLPQVSVAEGIRLLIPVLEALYFAHKRQICHRDLKPVNILVDETGRSALTDFGIAKEMDRDRGLTGRNIIGTATYLSPEQCLGEPVVPASDLYAMGVILYQLCAGRYPFEDASEITIIQKHVKETPNDVRSINPAISSELNAVVMKCLEKRPEDRYQHALELIRDLTATPEMRESVEWLLQRGELLLENRFRVLSLIEQGGFSEVYRVKEMRTGEIFALKILLPALTYDEDSLRRFNREIQILKSLKHPGILPVIADGVHTYKSVPLPFFVMPYFPGSLQAAMSEPVDRNKAMRVIMDVLEALAYAHEPERGVTHRDLKPSNILIGEDGKGYLTDFGIAKASKKLSQMATRNATMTRSFLGTSAYIAPEQIRNDPVDARSDIYSMGVILYEIAVGRKPFDGKTAELTTAMHLYEKPPLPSMFDADVPPKIEAIILKCLEKEPDRRFADVAELMQSLRAARHKGDWYGAQPAFHLHPGTWITSATRSLRTAGPYVGLVAAAFAFVAGMGVAAAHRYSRLGPPPGGVAGWLTRPALSIGSTQNVLSRRRALDRELALSAAPPTGAAKWSEPAPSAPPELLKARDASLYDAYELLSRARRKAKTEGNFAAFRASSSRLEGLLAQAPHPAFEIAGAARGRRIIQTQKDRDGVEVAVNLLLDNQPATEAPVKFDYAYKVFSGTDAAPVVGELGRPARFRTAELEAGAESSPRQYRVDLEAWWDGKPFRKIGSFEFGLVKRTKPVRVKAAQGKLEWTLDNAADFERCEWVLRRADGSAAPTRQPERKDRPFVLGEDEYKALPEGPYRLACLAYERDNPNPFESSEEDLIVDHTPPIMGIEPDIDGRVFLPGDPPTEVEITATDPGREAENKTFLFLRDGKEGLGSGAARAVKFRVAWRSPEGKASIAPTRLRFNAVDPGALFAARESAPAEMTIYNVSQDAFTPLLGLESLEQEVHKAKQDDPAFERYSRLERLAPIGPSAPYVGDRDKIRARIAELGHDEAKTASLFKDIAAALESRRAIFAKDREYAGLRAGFVALLPASASSDLWAKDALAKIERIDATWVAQPPTAKATDSLAALGEPGGILPPPEPAESVFAAVRDQANPMRSSIQFKPDFARQFGDQARYRYYLAADPDLARKDDKALDELLNASKLSTLDGAYTPNANEKIADLFLIAQVYLPKGPLGGDVESAPRVFHIGPLVTLDPKMQADAAELAKSLESAAQDADAYPRTAEWIRRHGADFPFIKGRQADLEWLIAHQDKAADVSGALEKLRGLQSSDKAFAQMMKDAAAMSRRVGAWDPDHQKAFRRTLPEAWTKAQESLTPESFIEEQVKAYRVAKAASLLEAPSGRPPTHRVKPGEFQVSRADVPSKPESETELKWEEGEPLGRASQLLGGKESATLPSPAKGGSSKLQARFTREEDGIPVYSAWATIVIFAPETPTPTMAPTKPPTPPPTTSPTPRPSPTSMPATPPPTTAATAMPPAPTKTAPPEPESHTGEIGEKEANEFFKTKVLPSLPHKGHGDGGDYAKLFAGGKIPSNGSALENQWSTGLKSEQFKEGQKELSLVKVSDGGGGKFRVDYKLRINGDPQSVSYEYTLRREGGGIVIVSDSKK